MSEHQTKSFSPRRARDRSIVLLLLGAVLLLPPFVGMSLVEIKLAGIPVTLLYVFAVWVVLIIGAQRLAKPLADRDSKPEPGSADPTGEA